MADEDVADQHDVDLDAVWADVWNPESNQWAPSQEPMPQYGIDAGQVEYQAHQDIPTAFPMSEQFGHPGQGTVPAAGMNVLTDVKGPPTSSAPPRQIIQHDVQVTETGSEVARVRQVLVSSTAPLNLLEENPLRKRALLRVESSAASIVTFSGNGTQFPLVITVPAGQSWEGVTLYFLYIASAVVATRTVLVTIRDDKARLFYQVAAPLNLTSAQQANFSLGSNLPYNGGGPGPFTITMPLPEDLILGPGWTIQISAVNSDNGDTASGQLQVAGGLAGSIFIAPRASGGGAAQPSSWFPLDAGAAPTELKTQEGIDAVSTGAPYVVAIYEELTTGEQHPLTGIV